MRLLWRTFWPALVVGIALTYYTYFHLLPDYILSLGEPVLESDGLLRYEPCANHAGDPCGTYGYYAALAWLYPAALGVLFWIYRLWRLVGFFGPVKTRTP
jgi:hypothetical protein